MSTIVAAKAKTEQGECVIMMADDKVSCGGAYSTFAPTQSKVFKLGDFLIGVAGDLRCSNIIRYCFDVPALSAACHETDPLDFMVTMFVPKLKETLKNEGYAEVSNNKEGNNSQMLVAYKNHIYEVSYDYSVLENDRDFGAIGSGESYALGAMHTYLCDGVQPYRDVYVSLVSAINTAAWYDKSTGTGVAAIDNAPTVGN